jgi:hypothetical protein
METTRSAIYSAVKRSWEQAGCTCIPTIVVENLTAQELRVTSTHEPQCAIRLVEVNDGEGQ